MEFDFTAILKKEKVSIFRNFLRLEKFKIAVEKCYGSQSEFTEDFMIEFMNKQFIDLLNSIEEAWEWDGDHQSSIYVKGEFIEVAKAAGFEQSEARDRRMELELMDEDEDENELIYPEKFDIGGAPYFWMLSVPELFKKKWFFETYPDVKEEWWWADFQTSIGCDG